MSIMETSVSIHVVRRSSSSASWGLSAARCSAVRPWWSVAFRLACPLWKFERWYVFLRSVWILYLLRVSSIASLPEPSETTSLKKHMKRNVKHSASMIGPKLKLVMWKESKGEKTHWKSKAPDGFIKYKNPPCDSGAWFMIASQCRLKNCETQKLICHYPLHDI